MDEGATVTISVLYLTTAALSVALGSRDRHNPAETRASAFWYSTAALLAAIATTRLTNVVEFVNVAARSQVRSAGWYDNRRPFQAAAALIVVACWAGVSALTIVRSPQRRRRLLPTALLTFTLLCFLAIKQISLHQVDSVLEWTVASVEFARIVEIAVLVALTGAVGRVFRSHDPAPPVRLHPESTIIGAPD